MLEHIDLVTLAKDISYRPGWEFSVRLWQLGEDLPNQELWQGESAAVLDILAVVPDSRTLEPTKVNITRVISKGVRRSPATFLDWVKAILIEFEYHELREFFKYRGELVDDPHASTLIRSNA